jgi:hypothetical protein
MHGAQKWADIQQNHNALMTRSMGWHLLQTQIQLKKYGCLKRKSVRPHHFRRANHERPYANPAKLKIQLQEQNITSPTHHNQVYSSYRPGSSSSSTSSGQTPTTGSKHLLHSIKNVSAMTLPQGSQSPELHGVADRSSADAVLELMYSGWNPDLPEPHILNH